jgi:hypothetical protein
VLATLLARATVLRWLRWTLEGNDTMVKGGTVSEGRKQRVWKSLLMIGVERKRKGWLI